MLCLKHLPDPPRSFYICALPRTGSNLLESYLNSHGSIRCYNEQFHAGKKWALEMLRARGMMPEEEGPAKIPWRRALQLRLGYKAATLNEIFWVRRNAPALFLEQWVLIPEKPPVEIVGCKLQPWQLLAHYSKTQRKKFIRSTLKIHRKAGLKILYLDRENILEQYVSTLVAVKLHAWRLRTKDALPPLELRKVEVEPEKFLAFIRSNRKKTRFFHDFFKDLPSLTLTYENMTTNSAAVLSGVLDFLEVERRPLTAEDLKINPEPLEQRILNYDALRNALKGTPEEAFLNT